MTELIVCVSRIYLIDGVETNVTAEGSNAQAALRNLDRAAEELGAAPGALPLTGSGGPAKNKGGRPKKAVAEPEQAGASALPAGVATAFAPPPAEPQLPFTAPTATVNATLSPPPTAATVTLTDDPPVPFERSSVGLAPPSGPPAFAPPPMFSAPSLPPVDPITALRNEASTVQKDMLAMIQTKSPGWLDGVMQTLNGVLGTFGGNIQTMTKEQLEGLIVQMRNYEATLKSHLGA